MNLPPKLRQLWHMVSLKQWQLVALFFALLTLWQLIAFLLQGETQTLNAVHSSQRFTYPLRQAKEPIKWHGELVNIAKKGLPKTLPGEATPPPEEPISGHAADLSGTKPEHVIEEQYTDEMAEKTEVEVVITNDLNEAAKKAEPPKEITTGKTEIQVEKRYDEPLGAAPLPELTENLDDYELPKISSKGDMPWQAYAKPYVDEGKPAISIIITGVGLGRMTTESSLNLDPRVALSFSPYAKNSRLWGDHARNIGHEILLDLPQQTQDFPASDPGPYALLNTLDVEQNKERLHWVLSRIPGFVGVLQPPEPAAPKHAVITAMGEIAKRGLLIIESPQEKPAGYSAKQQQMNMLLLDYDSLIDTTLSDEAIKVQLELIVQTALKEGSAIAVARPYPLTLGLIQKWIPTLEERGIELTPVSTLYKRKQ